MLCRFARTLPPRIADLLNNDKRLRRRFREETITDILMAALIGLHPLGIFVDFPDEPSTGSDMEWWFISRSRGQVFRLLIQAKRLHGSGNIWGRHSYREMKHTVRGRLQSQILVKAASKSKIPTYPLYILYNPMHTCMLAEREGVASVEGITLIDGYVAANIIMKVVKKKIKSSALSIRQLHLLFFPLSSLFCPSPPVFGTVSDSDFAYVVYGDKYIFDLASPDPVALRQRIVDVRQTGLAAIPRENRVGFEVPDVPNVGQSIPDDILAAVEFHTNPASGVERPRPERHRAILLSGYR